MRRTTATLAVTAAFALGLCTAEWALGNGGPFVVKYPSGDPAAKGVLARLDPTLKPARETRLRVIREDLTIRFSSLRSGRSTDTPLVDVSAAYTIENPTDQEIPIDFGFPILRGIYMRSGMVDTPDVRVTVDKQPVATMVITNSTIYGIIRQHARASIDRGIAADAELARLVEAVRQGGGATQAAAKAAQPRQVQQAAFVPQPPQADYTRAREALRAYLLVKEKWNARDAALLVEYASMDFGQMRGYPRDRWDRDGWDLRRDELARELLKSNLGPLAAIGEQKATQFFAQLAARFDPQVASTYESIFAAWGGEVRERSVDLATGEIRPRELQLRADVRSDGGDPTIYARVDYLDPDAKLTAAEKQSCENVLRNLPVVFTFAPMNLLHYQVTFPAKATRVVTIDYRQHAYLDTREKPSYQLAYVLHPASLWHDFGPIQFAVRVPKGIACRASVPLGKPVQDGAIVTGGDRTWPAEQHRATLVTPQEKRGELFVAIDKAGWDAWVEREAKPAAVAPSPTTPVPGGTRTGF